MSSRTNAYWSRHSHIAHFSTKIALRGGSTTSASNFGRCGLGARGDGIPFAKYPEKAEGELTAYRAALVNTVSIADAAGKLGMNEYLMLSRGESKDTGRARQIILANAFEALIGAIYLDAGYGAAQKFIGEQLFHKTDDVVANRLWQDAKSKLQETAQEELGITPAYRLLEQSGPDHDKQFVVGAYIGQEKIAQGEGRSKQEAEQDAAQKALAAKGW